MSAVGVVPYVVSGDALVREQARSAALLAALRVIAREADAACADGPDGDWRRSVAVTSIRKWALDSIADNKE